MRHTRRLVECNRSNSRSRFRAAAHTVPTRGACSIACSKTAHRTRFSFGRLDRKLRRLNIHVIDSAEYMSGLAPASRYNTDSGFIAALRDEGRARADAWLESNLGAIGQRSTVSLHAPLLQS